MPPESPDRGSAWPRPLRSYWMLGAGKSIVTVLPLLSVSVVVEPSSLAVTSIVTLWPALSDPLNGLTVKPDPPGTVIVYVTAPPSAVNSNEPA